MTDCTPKHITLHHLVTISPLPGHLSPSQSAAKYIHKIENTQVKMDNMMKCIKCIYSLAFRANNRNGVSFSMEKTTLNINKLEQGIPTHPIIPWLESKSTLPVLWCKTCLSFCSHNISIFNNSCKNFYQVTSNFI